MRDHGCGVVRVLLAALVAAFASAPSAVSHTSAAAPPISYGVADNGSLFADDGGAWFDSQLKAANLTEDRWEIQWDSSQPTTIEQLPFLQRAAPVARAAGIRVILVLDSKQPTAHAPAAFCAWAAQVATTASQWGIHDYVVWNEPNTARYWAPQNPGSPAQYEALLAQCYDAIHTADPLARLIGFGLSPRSNGPTQTAPIPFIAGVGAAYRASGRTKPIMDQMSLRPYPNPNSPTDGPGVGYANTQDYGVPNLDRVKQAVWDAFHGTGQPTTLDGLTFRIDELGWQTDTSQYSQYFNAENVKTVSEETQAADIATAVQKYFACDPTVTDVDWFLLVDESTRDGRSQDGTTMVSGGWQSGLMTAGGQGVSTPKVAYVDDAPLFAAGRAACTGAPVAWAPTVATHVYDKGDRGIDVSFPNCEVRLTGREGFAVVGVNGGRPFSFNPCLRGEYSHYAHSTKSAVYVNTGYEPIYGRYVTAACEKTRSRGIAYAVGCSEADASVRHLARLGLPQPRVWWLDVEPSNVWSARRAVNTSVLRGMMDYLEKSATTSIVGIYSMSPWWHEITTNWRTSAPEWIPKTGARCPAAFSAGPVWLTQTGSSRLDLDIAC